MVAVVVIEGGDGEGGEGGATVMVVVWAVAMVTVVVVASVLLRPIVWEVVFSVLVLWERGVRSERVTRGDSVPKRQRKVGGKCVGISWEITKDSESYIKIIEIKVNWE